MNTPLVQEVTAVQAYEAKSSGATIVDVREEEEFVAGHIAGAVSLPLSRVVDDYKTLPLESEIIVNCRSGARSARAVSFLRSMGVDAKNLSGGVIAWNDAGLPLVTESGIDPVIA
ncbi:MAG: rhodanese-like domain-containing protein [Actinomycetota bacterium]|nr:rhodanese-like domain-containing protein [Actinomycetota bacterium]